jgi:hypothetical protein
LIGASRKGRLLSVARGSLMPRFLEALTFALTIALLLPAPLAAQDSSAVGIIQVREEVDGAGPSNVVHLRDDVVALADPLKGDTKAFDMASKKVLGACGMPRDFKPWRIVRGRNIISIVDEAERSTLDIPRAQVFAAGCALKVRAFSAARDRFHRLRRMDQRAIAMPPRPREPGKPLIVRSAAYELLSARELERDRSGNRYVLAKVLQPEDLARPGRLGVTVTVLRYDARGRINGAYRVPFEDRKKRAFDYVTVLPRGDLVLALHHKDSDPRKRGQFLLERVPMPHFVASKRNLIPASAPAGTDQDEFEMATEPLAIGHLAAGGQSPATSEAVTPTGATPDAISGPQIVAEARRYLDQTWDYRRPGTEGQMKRAEDGVYLWRIGNTEHKWVEPAHHRGIPPGTKLRGLAYNFGGVDTPASFLAKLERGAPAGQLGDPINLPDSRCSGDAPFTATAGIDCSALLARAWRFDPCSRGQRAFSTRAFEKPHDAICPAPVPSFSALKEGDAINSAGSHVVIFLRTEAPDGASKMVRVIESASRCSGVCEARYELDAYDGWILHRRTGRSDASCPRRS